MEPIMPLGTLSEIVATAATAPLRYADTIKMKEPSVKGHFDGYIGSVLHRVPTARCWCFESSGAPR